MSHLRPNLFSFEDSWLQSLEDHAIGTLHLPVHLWMRHSRPVHMYVDAVAERQELLACELGVVVGDDRVRDPEPEDDVGEE